MLAGVSVGLGFETKMAVALIVVPGIVAAWLWIAPATKGRLHALRQLLELGLLGALTLALSLAIYLVRRASPGGYALNPLRDADPPE